MTEKLSYTITEAAERIGPAVTVDWLKHHIAEIPHTKSGNGRGRSGRVAFTETHLHEILLMLEKRPEGSPGPTQPEEFHSVVTRRRSA